MLDYTITLSPSNTIIIVRMAPASESQSNLDPIIPTAYSGGRRCLGAAANNLSEHCLVSVITAVFNGELHLDECIRSVLAQDYPHAEHIIIDGGSTDGTLDILHGYNDQVALWKSEPDKGIYDAWNKGLLEARGEWICFIGSDDALLPGAIRKYMELATRYPNAEYLSSQVRWEHPSGYINPGHGKAWAWPRFARSMCVAHVGSMHHRSLFERIGSFDISYRSAADYELLLRARNTLQTAYMATPTAVMRAGGVSDSLRAFNEAARAKIESGRRNSLISKIELHLDRLKFKLGPCRRFIGKFIGI